jgi:hypothetical protein
LRLPWRLRRLAATVLDSDELRRSPPLRCRSIDRSSDGGSAYPRDLLDCFLVVRIPFASEASDLGHGYLELAPELLGLVHGEIWLGELGVLSTYRRRLPLARCRRGRAGTASPCHGGISRALCKCSTPPSPPLHLTVTTWSLLPSWSLLHALLECCSMLYWSLLRAGHAHLELALAKLTWSLCWPCSSRACAGQILLPFAIWGFSPSCTGAVRFSDCDVS